MKSKLIATPAIGRTRTTGSKALLTVGALLTCAPVGAHAQATAIAGGSPGFIAVSIPVTASVANVCAFSPGLAPGGSYSIQSVDAGFALNVSFVLQCNGPSRIGVQSANGGLLIPNGNPPAGYTGLAPYQITLYVAGDSGVSTVTATCAAQALSATAQAPCSFRGPASSSQGLELPGASNGDPGSYLSVSAPAYSGPTRLIASTAYTDTLTVTVSAAL